MSGKKLTTVKTKADYYDLIYLLSCLCDESNPSLSRVLDMDLNAIYQISKVHGISSLVYTIVEDSVSGVPKDELGEERILLLKRWEKSQLYSIYRETRFDEERDKLFKYCDDAGIWYMPLKGVILKEYYKYFGLRQMSDNDILFDEKYDEHIHTWFVEHGYTVANYRVGNHDVYVKDAITFEMHKKLFGTQDGEIFWGYYHNVKDKLIPTGGMRFRFSDEDFYIYIIAHAYKHYCGGGMGLRTLLDLHLYLNEKNNLDWKYIEDQLKILRISAFEKMIRHLTSHIFDQEFSPDMLNCESRNFLEKVLITGIGDNVKDRVSNTINVLDSNEHTKNRKLKYALGRLFPSVEFMKDFYPFCRMPLLLPVAYVYRILRQGITNTKNIIIEFHTLWRT